VTLEHVSRLLADNPLGDPHVRKLSAWLPPQYDQEPGAASGVVRPGRFHRIRSLDLNWKPFEKTSPSRRPGWFTNARWGRS